MNNSLRPTTEFDSFNIADLFILDFAAEKLPGDGRIQASRAARAIERCLTSRQAGIEIVLCAAHVDKSPNATPEWRIDGDSNETVKGERQYEALRRSLFSHLPSSDRSFHGLLVVVLDQRQAEAFFQAESNDKSIELIFNAWMIIQNSDDFNHNVPPRHFDPLQLDSLTGGIRLLALLAGSRGRAIVLCPSDAARPKKRVVPPSRPFGPASVFSGGPPAVLVEDYDAVDENYLLTLLGRRRFAFQPQHSELPQARFCSQGPVTANRTDRSLNAKRDEYDHWFRQEFGSRSITREFLELCRDAFGCTGGTHGSAVRPRTGEAPRLLSWESQIAIGTARLCRRMASWMLEGEPFRRSVLLLSNDRFETLVKGGMQEFYSLITFPEPVPFDFQHLDEIRNHAEIAQGSGLFLVVNVADGKLHRIAGMREQASPASSLWHDQMSRLIRDNGILFHVRPPNSVEVYGDSSFVMQFDGFEWTPRPFRDLEKLLTQHFGDTQPAQDQRVALADAARRLLDDHNSSIFVLLHDRDHTELYRMIPERLRDGIEWTGTSSIAIDQLDPAALSSLLQLDGCHVIDQKGRVFTIARKIAVPPRAYCEIPISEDDYGKLDGFIKREERFDEFSLISSENSDNSEEDAFTLRLDSDVTQAKLSALRADLKKYEVSAAVCDRIGRFLDEERYQRFYCVNDPFFTDSDRCVIPFSENEGEVSDHSEPSADTKEEFREFLNEFVLDQRNKAVVTEVRFPDGPGERKSDQLIDRRTFKKAVEKYQSRFDDGSKAGPKGNVEPAAGTAEAGRGNTKEIGQMLLQTTPYARFLKLDIEPTEYHQIEGRIKSPHGPHGSTAPGIGLLPWAGEEPNQTCPACIFWEGRIKTFRHTPGTFLPLTVWERLRRQYRNPKQHTSTGTGTRAAKDLAAHLPHSHVVKISASGPPPKIYSGSAAAPRVPQ